MSRSEAPPRGGYQRSASGLLGAMVATVLAVLAFVAFRGLTRDNEPTQVPSMDWQISLRAARAEHHLQALAPASLPAGWKATSVSYLPGADPAWHLGMLTREQKYVGVEDARADLDDLVHDHVDQNAVHQGTVRIGGQTWQVYTDAGGDYALGRTMRPGTPSVESQLVVGSAPEATIREFAATLRGGRVTG